jgi:putative transposase
MAQSLSRVLLHIVFSTKYRHEWIAPDIAPRLHAYLAEACRNLGCEAFRVGGTENHVHIACTLPRTLTIAMLIERMKSSSSEWMKTQGEQCIGFTWQSGYGAFSLGASQLDTLTRYIENQVEHHKTTSFQDELRTLLRLYSVEFNEKYLWNE